MEWHVRAFLKASLFWLTLGVTLGVAMAVHPLWTVYRPAHMHMNLLGFVTMMIFGVGYHVIPRFSGHPLHSRRAPRWHWWMSNVGLALMAIGFALRAHALGVAGPVLGVGGTLSAAGAYTFVYVIWRTIDGPAGMRRAMERTERSFAASARPPLPVSPERTAGER